MKYKYYHLKSTTKEAIGVISASNINEAYNIASALKQLPIDKFKNLFAISSLNDER
jgi:hypothetical protein